MTCDFLREQGVALCARSQRIEIEITVDEKLKLRLNAVVFVSCEEPVHEFSVVFCR